MKDMKLPGFPKSAEDEFKTQPAIGTTEQKSMMERLFGSVYSVLTDVAGAVAGGAQMLADGAEYAEMGINSVVNEMDNFLFGETIIIGLETSAEIDTVERGGEKTSENIKIWEQYAGKNTTVTIEKQIPGFFEKIGLGFGKIFGGDAGKLKAMVRERGDKWDDEGVNVVALRNSEDAKGNTIKYGENTFDDVMIVVKGGEVVSAVYGSTEPGKPGYFTLVEGQHLYSFAEKNDNPKWKEDTFKPTTFKGQGYGFSVSTYDSNKNGIVDDGDRMISTSGSRIHPGDRSNKLKVSDYSQGCQVIALDRYYDAVNNITFNYSDAKYKSPDRMYAYSNFVTDIGRKQQTVRYNLYNRTSSKLTQNLYNRYNQRLSQVNVYK